MKPLFTQVDMLTDINTIFWATENPRVIREHERDSLKANVWCARDLCWLNWTLLFDTPTVTSDVYLQMVQIVQIVLPTASFEILV